MTLRLMLVVLAAIVTWAFAAMTLRQYLARRRPQQAAWALGVLFFALAVSIQLVPLTQEGWTPGWYRLWYYSAAILNTLFLGQGTVYLLLQRRTAHALMLLAGLVALVSGVLVWSAPLDLARVAGEQLLTGRAFPEIRQAGFATPRAWAPIVNSYATFWLMGGAAWSAWHFWRSGQQRDRAVGTALIAAAALVLALTSTLTNFVFPGFEELGRLVGVSLLFAGFLRASRPAPVLQPISSLAS